MPSLPWQPSTEKIYCYISIEINRSNLTHQVQCQASGQYQTLESDTVLKIWPQAYRLAHIGDRYGHWKQVQISVYLRIHELELLKADHKLATFSICFVANHHPIHIQCARLRDMRSRYTIYYGPVSFIISTLSGRDGRLDSLPTVGYLTPDTFQTISLSDSENLKTGRRTARTTSVQNHQFHACD